VHHRIAAAPVLHEPALLVAGESATGSGGELDGAQAADPERDRERAA